MGRQARIKKLRRQHATVAPAAELPKTEERQVKEYTTLTASVERLDLIEQARSIVMKALTDKKIVLTADEPWKKTAKRLLTGKDVPLGALNEVFRALSIKPFLATDQCVIGLGETWVCTTPDRVIDMVLMLQGDKVNGFQFTKESLERFRSRIPEPSASN